MSPENSKYEQVSMNELTIRYFLSHPFLRVALFLRPKEIDGLDGNSFPCNTSTEAFHLNVQFIGLSHSDYTE